MNDPAPVVEPTVTPAAGEPVVTAAEPIVGVEPVSTAPTVEPGSFLESLPEKYRQEPSLMKYKDQEAMLDSYLSMERYRANSVPIPGDDATPEARAEYLEKLQKRAPELMLKPSDENSADFWETMGMPKEAKDYSLPEGIAEGNGFADIAHEAHLTNEQYGNVMAAVNKAELAMQEQAQAAYNAEIKSLHDEWGQAYNDRYAEAYAAARAVGADEQAFADGTAAPSSVRAYYKIATMLGAEGINLAGKEVISDRMTPTETRDRIGEIMTKLKGMAPTDPQYKDLLAEKRRMYQTLPENKGEANPGYDNGAGQGGVNFG